ncbi:MAG: TonB-dependent receptor [Steroidobacteraceae bacterium]
MTISRTGHRLLLASSVLLPIVLSSTAQAQSEASAGFTLEEITITATKRETDLQKTAMSITALDGEEIEKSGKSNLAQILQDTAGVTANTAGQFGYYFWVRGIGSSPTFGQDAAVTTSVNGVFQQTAQSSRGTFYDIGRVEVARGPQSTLNGRNALGGSIAVITAEPKLEYEASGTVGIGNYHLLNSQGMLNAPLPGGISALRLAFSTEKRDGYISNGSNDSDVEAGRLRWLIQPSDDLKIILSADRQKSAGRGVGQSATGMFLPTETTEFSLGRYCRTVLECAGAVTPTGGAAAGFNSLPFVDSAYTTFNPRDPVSRQFTSTSYYGELNWDLGGAQLYVQPAWQKTDVLNYNHNFNNRDYALWSARVQAQQPGWTNERKEQFARALATSLGFDRMIQEQKTFEVRISSPADSKLQWLGGLYYFNNKEATRTSMAAGGNAGVYTAASGAPFCITSAGVTAATPFGSGCGTGTTGIPADAIAVIRNASTDPTLADWDVIAPFDPRREVTDYAGYAQLTYPIRDDLRLTGSSRYTRETKWRGYDPQRNYNRDDGNPASSGIFTTFSIPETEITWNNLDYRVTVDYDLAESSMIYASISTGFRGGGFLNIAATGLRPGFKNYYDPEKLTSYEIGTRNDFMNKRLRVNATAYYYDYTDYQYTYNALVFADQDPQSSTAITINAGDSKSYGAELETRFLLTETDELGLNATYSKTELGQFTLPGGTAASVIAANNLAGQPFRRAPEWTILPSYRHRFNLGSAGSLTAAVDAHFESWSYINNPAGDTYLDGLVKQDAYHRENASLGYESSDGQFSVTAFVRNISDEVVKGTIGPVSGFTATSTVVQNLQYDPGEPRTYGVTFSANF